MAVQLAAKLTASQPQTKANGLPGRLQACHHTASVPCNLCGSTDVDILSRKDRNGSPLRTVICISCGLIRTDPRPNRQTIREFYTREYRGEYKQVQHPKRKHVLRAARDSIRRCRTVRQILQPGATVLDVGSGTGVFVYILNQLGFHGYGIEPDENFSRYSAEILNIDVSNGFLEEFEGVGGQLDAVWFHHVLEHMEDPFAALRKAHALLTSDGFVVVEVPNAEDLRQAPYHRYHKAHLYAFNPETLAALGEKAGFHVHDRTVGPRNGNITAIFRRRGDSSAGQPELAPDNCRKITEILERQNAFRYFATPSPYATFVAKLLGSIEEKRALRGYSDEREVINAVINTEIRAGS